MKEYYIDESNKEIIIRFTFIFHAGSFLKKAQPDYVTFLTQWNKSGSGSR